MHEQADFRQIGTAVTRAGNSPSNRVSIAHDASGNLLLSGTTGPRNLAEMRQNSIGKLLGATGADALPSLIPGEAPGRKALRALLDGATRLASQQNVPQGELVQAAIDYACGIAECLKPAPRGWIETRVAVLLSHYFTTTEDDEFRAMTLMDWGRTLGRYPKYAIDEACSEWMRSERRRPLPADILGRLERFDFGGEKPEAKGLAMLARLTRFVEKTLNGEPAREPRPALPPQPRKPFVNPLADPPAPAHSERPPFTAPPPEPGRVEYLMSLMDKRRNGQE